MVIARVGNFDCAAVSSVAIDATMDNTTAKTREKQVGRAETVFFIFRFAGLVAQIIDGRVEDVPQSR